MPLAVRPARAERPVGRQLDDIRFAQYVDPPLTTIRQPMRELGEATVRLLSNILRGNVQDAVSVTLPHALIVRASAAAPRSRTVISVAGGQF
jgi:Periplasmic binding protein-like domain